ncbi:RNase H-like domain found in reverse transcriptase [Popillia japonica]|uniref:RNase H-like domain found in reverse transcriptase n=1 Tax=Popillia japonica TaxID=7064 RepID=A0AAW1HVR4_POPJA
MCYRYCVLTLNPQKCHFLAEEIQHLGFEVSEKGIKPSRAKIKNPQKCHFSAEEIQYLGFEVSEKGIKPSRAKIKCIEDFPTPSSVHNVRQFIGHTSYFRRFVQDYAVKARPLTSLLRQAVSWNWGTEQERCFMELKECLTRQPVLSLYSSHAETELHTDARISGLGGILLQKQDDGYFHLVPYASRQTCREDSRYHSTELETIPS